MPNTQWYIKEVLDALLSLTMPDNWEKSGDVTVDEVISASTTLIESFSTMLGTIQPIATTDVPEYMLLCNGAMYSKADYPRLYDVLDAAFIVDADTFVTPNLMGRVVMGASVDYVVGTSGGEIEHTLTVDEIPAHTHIDSGHSHPIKLIDSLAFAPGEEPVVVPQPLIAPYFTESAQANLENTGGGAAHNNLQTYLALRWGIVAQ
jgi:microcystin-dependent protein